MVDKWPFVQLLFMENCPNNQGTVEIHVTKVILSL